MKKSLIITSTLLIVGMFAVSAFAWGPGRGSGNPQDCPRYNSFQDSQNNLTQEQRDELSVLHQKYIDETYTIRSEKMIAHKQMQMLMGTSSPDRKALNALSDKLTDLQKQLRDKRIDYMLEAKKIAPDYKFSHGRGKWAEGGRHHNRFENGCGRYNN